MPKLTPFALLALAGLAVACTSDSQAPGPMTRAGRACFLATDVGGWKEAQPGKLNMRTTRNEYYEAVLFGPCPGIDFSQQMAIATRFSERVCEGDDATLILPQRYSVGPERCRIDRIRKLTAEEVAALAPGDRP